MQMRENKSTIEKSMATILEIEGREHLVGHIIDALGKQGVVVTDEMIHVTHYGFDDRINWDEHIIVVDRFGVFGFTDGPCARSELITRVRPVETAQQLCLAEAERTYGVDR